MSGAPGLQAVAATLRVFVERAGALRAVALLDRGPGGAPVVVDCDAGGTVELEQAGAVTVMAATDAGTLPLPEVRTLPPMDVDAQRGEVIGTVGGVQHLADAVGALAAVLGGRSVAAVQFETTDAEMPLAVSARAGEPAVLALGDAAFTLPDA